MQIFCSIREISILATIPENYIPKFYIWILFTLSKNLKIKKEVETELVPNFSSFISS